MPGPDASLKHIECVASNRYMPDPVYQNTWDSIVVAPLVKERLLRGLLLELKYRARMSFQSSALHGLVLVWGPPGTGKTTLCHGAVQELCPRVGGRVKMIEIALPQLASSSAPNAIQELLCETVPQLLDPIVPNVLLLDEIESVAVSRNLASLEANSADVHRMTNSLLGALDNNAILYPQLIVLATSNFVEGLDAAVRSRVDLSIQIPKPDQAAIMEILQKTLREFAVFDPTLLPLANDRAQLTAAVQLLDGKDGRRVRKVVLEALGLHWETIERPGLLTIRDLIQAVQLTSDNPELDLRRVLSTRQPATPPSVTPF